LAIGRKSISAAYFPKPGGSSMLPKTAPPVRHKQ
jgi:hypothetical protein